MICSINYSILFQNQNVQTATKKGLVLFEIDHSTGALVGDANIYNFHGSHASYTSNLDGFVTRIAGIYYYHTFCLHLNESDRDRIVVGVISTYAVSAYHH